jgi:basic membrane protein A
LRRAGHRPGGIAIRPHEDAWSGLARLLTRARCSAQRISSRDAADFEKNIQYFVGRAFDVVITIGSVQANETEAAAAAAPTTLFAGFGQQYSAPPQNLASMIVPYEQIGFVAGWLAARRTRTRTVAAICEDSGLESMWLTCEGFRSGVRYADPDVLAVVSYRDDQPSSGLFSDPEWAAESVANLVRTGADVIFATGGGTGQGALTAATQQGLFAIGAERDQWYFVPEARPWLITSVYPTASGAVEALVASMAADQHTPLAVQVPVVVAPFHGLDGSASVAEVDALAVLVGQLASGEIQVEVTPRAAD